MPSIHVKDKLAARYAILTGDAEDFKDFVNHIVEEAINQEEGKVNMIKKGREEKKHEENRRA